MRAVIDFLRKIYKMAGYDFDSSIIQLASDLKIEHGFLSRVYVTTAMITCQMAEAISQGAEQGGVPLNSFCPEEVAVAIQSIVAK